MFDINMYDLSDLPKLIMLPIVIEEPEWLAQKIINYLTIIISSILFPPARWDICLYIIGLCYDGLLYGVLFD